MAEIQLSRGEVSVVDDEHHAFLSQFRWHMSAGGYAVRRVPGGLLSMHRAVLNAPDGVVVDHRNGDKLDNRAANLRLCTHAENIRNRPMHKNNQCGAKGVYADFSRKTPRYRAQIRIDGKCIRLGSFPTVEAAHEAYVAAAAKYHGEFART